MKKKGEQRKGYMAQQPRGEEKKNALLGHPGESKHPGRRLGEGEVKGQQGCWLRI